ncbi:MAG: glycosyltransferase family 2 protein [Rickettsiales bacterium]|nr:glycosyltransferase family 2 protein [Rickettsiales bacterium]
MKENSDNKILTILIPTYNRANNLKTLLQSFYNKLNDKVELLAAINSSSDDSLEIAESYKLKIPNLKIIFFSDFVHSAEENINRSIKHCSGEYIFILGDDDEVMFDVFDNLVFILENQKDKKITALIFNNISSQNILTKFSDLVSDLNYIQLGNISASKKIVSTNQYPNLIRQCGLITTIAFISRYVIRRDLFKEFSDYITISRIYSHVFAFIEFFGQQEVIVVDLPLVKRGDSDVKNRFDNFADTLSQSRYFNWVVGILKHFDNLVKKNIITSSFFYEIKEFREDGSMFYLWSNTLKSMLLQLYNYVADFDEREKLDSAATDLFLKFDKSSLSKAERKVIDFTVKNIDEIILIEKSKISKKEKDLISWKLRKLTDLVYCEYSSKIKISFGKKFLIKFLIPIFQLIDYLYKIFSKKSLPFLQRKIFRLKMEKIFG